MSKKGMEKRLIDFDEGLGLENDSNIFSMFENEMRNYKLELLANKIKFQTYRPKQRIFFY